MTEPTWTDKDGALNCECASYEYVKRIVDRLAHIERQILYRDESMPVWAKLWEKRPGSVECECVFSGGAGEYAFAPDYRPDEDGPITLAIIDDY